MISYAITFLIVDLQSYAPPPLPPPSLPQPLEQRAWTHELTFVFRLSACQTFSILYHSCLYCTLISNLQVDFLKVDAMFENLWTGTSIASAAVLRGSSPE